MFGRVVFSEYWISVGVNMDSNEHGSRRYSTNDQLVGVRHVLVQANQAVFLAGTS